MTDETRLAANDAAPQGQLPLFYQDPQPLDPSVYGSAGLKAQTTCAFAATTHAIPIAVSEFAMVQKHFPIAFVPGDDAPAAVALVGLRENENLFVNSDGTWDDDTYIPAYVRRYPFVFGQDTEQQRNFLCVDVKAEAFAGTTPAQPFFDGNEPTEMTKQALEFCRQFNDDLNLTYAFGQELDQRKLLKEVEMRYRDPVGRDVAVGRLTSIDTEAFDKLGTDEFLDFRTRGLLPLIYFQITSLTNWSRLGNRWHRRQAASGTANA